MSSLDLYADELNGRLHVAVVRKTVLADLYADSLDRAGAWGSVYSGKVTKIDKSLDAAVIDLGAGLYGLLPAKHVHLSGAGRSEERTGIAELLSPGQQVMVQVKAEAKKSTPHENAKMPRLTTRIVLPGQFLSYSPFASQVTISSSLGSEETLALTARLKGKGGWIVKLAAQDADADEIQAEAQRLQEDWQVISAMTTGEPRLLKAGPDALSRALFDNGEKSFGHIHIGSKDIFAAMTAWCEKFSPALATSRRLRLFKPEKVGQRLFDINDIAGEIEDLRDKRVSLPSGGTLVIDAVHAMTVIDVNQGPAFNHAAANAEAAREIARQIRLRNISGAILADFITTTNRADRQRLQEEIESALLGDHAGAQMHGFTRLGIAEITRKRRTASYAEKISG